MRSGLRSSPPLACGLALMRRAPFGASSRSSGSSRPVSSNSSLRLVAAQPFLQLLQMRGFLVHVRHRHLMGAPEAFDLVAVDLLRAGPALRAAQDDHRPARARDRAVALARASSWIRRISCTQCSSVAAIA